jgi:hypothetical protein
MMDVFDQTPRIYGFNSIGPSGANAEPLLKNYFSAPAIQQYYQTFKYFNDINLPLAQAFSTTALIQTEGHNLNKQPIQEQKSYCYLNDSQITRLAKINYIKKALQGNAPLTFIPYVEKFIRLMANEKLSSEEQKALRSIGTDSKNRAEFERILNLKGDVYMSIRTSLFQLMRDLKMVSEKEYQKRIVSLLEIDFTRPISYEKKDIACSLGIQVNIPLTQIPESRFQELNFYSLVSCFKPQDKALHRALYRSFIENPDAALRAQAAYTLGSIRVKDPKMLSQISRVARTDENEEVREAALVALTGIKPRDKAIQRMILNALQKDNSPSVQEAAGYALIAINPESEEILHEMVELLRRDEDPNIRERIAHIFAEMRASSPEILSALGESLVQDEEPVVRAAAAQALVEVHSQKADVQTLLLRSLKNDPVPMVRTTILELLAPFSDLSAETMMAIENISQKDPNTMVQEVASSILKKRRSLRR